MVNFASISGQGQKLRWFQIDILSDQWMCTYRWAKEKGKWSLPEPKDSLGRALAGLGLGNAARGIGLMGDRFPLAGSAQIMTDGKSLESGGKVQAVWRFLRVRGGVWLYLRHAGGQALRNAEVTVTAKTSLEGPVAGHADPWHWQPGVIRKVWIPCAAPHFDYTISIKSRDLEVSHKGSAFLYTWREFSAELLNKSSPSSGGR